MRCERRAGPGGSPSPLPSSPARATRFPAVHATAGLALLLGACAGLPDVLQSPPHNELAARAPEHAARRRHFAPGELEAFRLANGLSVVTLEDHSLPRVVVDLWLDAGTRDEPPGGAGLALLVEELLLAGTDGAPGGPRDPRLEHGGGTCGASADRDRTRWFGLGPPQLLPDLIALAAERMAALAAAAEHAVPSTGAGRSVESHGGVEPRVPAALYPEDHPYWRPVPGEDVAPAPGPDVVAAFLRERCGPASASLVVAGALDPRAARRLVERAFGDLSGPPPPARRPPAAVQLGGERALVTADRVPFPRLALVWPSPPAFAPGDAELDLLATILAEGPASRLERRLVLDLRLAQEVDAGQDAGELGSAFVVQALAAPGADLDAIEREILAVLGELAREGPDEAELERALERAEARFRRRMESLLARAEAVQAYRRAFGTADGFARDLARWTDATREDVRAAARATFGPGRIDLRILPIGPAPAAAPEPPAQEPAAGAP